MWICSSWRANIARSAYSSFYRHTNEQIFRWINNSLRRQKTGTHFRRLDLLILSRILNFLDIFCFAILSHSLRCFELVFAFFHHSCCYSFSFFFFLSVSIIWFSNGIISVNQNSYSNRSFRTKQQHTHTQQEMTWLFIRFGSNLSDWAWVQKHAQFIMFVLHQQNGIR